MDRWIPSGMHLLPCALLVVAACESPPAPSPVPAATPAPAERPLGTFSPDRAFADVEELALRSTPAGEDSEGALRDYVTSQLAATGLAIETLEVSESPEGVEPDAGGARSWKHVVATAPGASPDLVLLVARLGGVRAGADAEQLREDESGAALLLELARVLSTRSLPYTTRFMWLEGESPGDAEPGAGEAPEHRGSEALAARMAARGELSRVRLLVAFERVCRQDLHIARDLRSHRVHREEFFDAAARTGRVQFFPRNQDYESVEGTHLAFRSAGVRPVVVLTAASSTLGDRACAVQSLEAVGTVSLEGLDAIWRRLAKIDRFSRAPLGTAGEGTASPGAAPAAPPQQSTPSASAPVEP